MIIWDAVACGHILLHEAEGIVLARIVRTDEYLLFAVDARIAHGTGAGIGGQFVHTDAAVLAGRGGAFIDLLLTDAAMPARRALAAEFQATALNALAAVLATGPSACNQGSQ